MSLTHQTTAPRALCLSSCNLRTSTTTRRSRYIIARSFWWGRHGYCQKYTSNLRHGPSLCKTQQFVSGRQSSRAKASPSGQIKKDPIYQYTVSHGWRLLSSWGKSSSSKPSPVWESTTERKPDAVEREYAHTNAKTWARNERLKRQVEEDPFGVLFGGRAAERAWYPWHWSAKSCKTSQKPNSSWSTSSELTEENVSGSNNTSLRGTTGSDKRAPESIHDPEVEEYVYDPISMRRVPKSTHRANSSSAEKSSVEKSSANKSQSTTKASTAPDAKAPSSPARTPARKIESSLDRHLRKGSSPNGPAVESEVSEPQAAKVGDRSEDLETLRAGDIRAAFARLKEDFVEREKTLQEQTDKRRQSMQETFEKRMNEIEAEFTKETSGSGPQSQPSSTTPQGPQSTEEHRERGTALRHACEEQEKADALTAQRHKKQEADSKLALEIEVQKAAMDAHESQRSKAIISDNGNSSASLGEGDLNAQVLQFATSERWYKKPAPHALARERASLVKREEQKARDRALVREIRDAYETSYGIIDTKHRQGPILTSQQSKIYEDISPAHSAPQPANSHPELSEPPSSSAVHSEADSVVVRSNLTSVQHIAVTQPNYSPVKVHPLLQHCLELALVAETNLWNILECMQSIYLSASPQVNKARVSKLSARLVDNSGKMQADLQALAISNFDVACRNIWDRQAHSRSNLETLLARRRILRDVIGSCSEQHSNGKPVPIPKEETGTDYVVPTKPEKQVYKILALSFDTHKVTSATTSSSLYESSTPPKSAASILSHLSHPASFIPHIEALQHTDFELVAGSRNMLVYKQISVEPVQSKSSDLKSSDPKREPSTSSNSEQIKSTEDILVNETRIPQSKETAIPISSSQSGSPSIRITVNSPSGSIVKIDSMSVTVTEQVPFKDTPASGDPTTAKEASSSTTVQSLDLANTESPKRPHVKEKSLPEENLFDNLDMAETSDKAPREGPVTQRRRRRGLWKRFRRLVVRSFLLGGLCYFAGCFSVWYQKRKEAQERAEKSKAIFHGNECAERSLSSERTARR